MRLKLYDPFVMFVKEDIKEFKVVRILKLMLLCGHDEPKDLF